MATTSKSVIMFPLSVFETAETKTDLEDWLMANSREFVNRMRKSRKDDLDQKGKSWHEVKNNLCIK